MCEQAEYFVYFPHVSTVNFVNYSSLLIIDFEIWHDIIYVNTANFVIVVYVSTLINRRC